MLLDHLIQSTVGFKYRNSQSRTRALGLLFPLCRHSSLRCLPGLLHCLPPAFAQIFPFSATMLFKNSWQTPHSHPTLPSSFPCFYFLRCILVFSCIPCILLDIWPAVSYSPTLLPPTQYPLECKVPGRQRDFCTYFLKLNPSPKNGLRHIIS